MDGSDCFRFAERELTPKSRIVDAFLRPPTYRAPERPTPTNRRRSVDSTLLLGSMDDVNPDDPVFMLRRAISYRNSTYRHRMSAPLDEIALQKLHRDSLSSASSSDPANLSHDSITSHQKLQPTRQEIIARQREATRANQRAILSAQSNSVRGMDVLLPGNAMLRSSRYDVNDRMRYSYVEPDGETYDISDIVEEELRDNYTAGRNDLLEGVLGKKDAVGEKLNRVLSKIKSGKQNKKEKDLVSLSSVESRRSGSGSEYSLDESIPERAQSVTLSGGVTPTAAFIPRPGTTTPTGKPAATGGGGSRRNPSIASVMSDLSGYDTAGTHPTTNYSASNDDSPTSRSWATPTPTLKLQQQPPPQQQRRIVIPTDDFGVSHMLALIEYKSAAGQSKGPLQPLHPVDEMLFGRPLDVQDLHPVVREIYAPGVRQLEEIDKVRRWF